MSVREIPPGEWQTFLDRFSREHRAWLASVDRLGPGTGPHTEVREQPLGSVTADRAARGIRIQFQQDSKTSNAIRIDAPSRIRVDETPDGQTRMLEIEDERGECTRIRLRVPTPPGLLDGLAPGEL
jgi:hypothetical protein